MLWNCGAVCFGAHELVFTFSEIIFEIELKKFSLENISSIFNWKKSSLWSRIAAFSHCVMGLFFFFMSISGIFSIIIDNTFLSKLNFFSVSRRNYVFCPQYILTSKFLQGSSLNVIISVFFVRVHKYLPNFLFVNRIY